MALPLAGKATPRDACICGQTGDTRHKRSLPALGPEVAQIGQFNISGNLRRAAATSPAPGVIASSHPALVGRRA